jgi:hypothetical protein
MRALAALLLLALPASALALEPPPPTLAERAEARLDQAEAALAEGRWDDAGAALANSWALVGSAVWERAWAGDEDTRLALGERWRAGARRLGAARALPGVIARRDEARAAMSGVDPAAKPSREPWRAARAAAEACVEAARAGDVDPAWVVPGASLSLAQVAQDCGALAAQAIAGAEEADKALAARDAELRQILRGDRLAVYEQHGEPQCVCGKGSPKEIARAKEWTYLRGPSGPLETYETLVFTFAGNKLVGQRARISKERP